ncbi:pilin [Actinoplanes sp. M2I2]|uniref:pilin n=1 Tax=Actinoplanes sp. M2I2 TaxID=1734444 RepID=UPI0020226ECA|nr:pilin [Actinoplanes sp. M2I2]
MFRFEWARMRALTVPFSPPPRMAARRLGRCSVPVTAAVLILLFPDAAFAGPGGAVVLAANSLPQVITNLQVWLMGILWSLAGLFALLGAMYRTTAGGDPGRVEKSNEAFRNAAYGAALGVLAPVILQVVRQIVGG